MVGKCINEACNRRWALLGDGAVYMLERRGQHTTEFFWLCSACMKNFVVAKGPEGKVIAIPKSASTRASLPDPDFDLRLIFRPCRNANEGKASATGRSAPLLMQNVGWYEELY